MNVRKRVAAATCALMLTLGSAVMAAPSAGAAVRNGIGSGAVDIAATYSTADCQRLGHPAGCASFGAGVVVPNPWNNNEVITNYHVIEGATAIYIKIPGDQTDWWYGYLQHWDASQDLAVLWIYKAWSPSSGFTYAPQFQESNIVPGVPANGRTVEALGDSNGDSFNYGTYMDYHYGTIVNDWYSTFSARRPYDGVTETLYNLIKSNAQTAEGDSGGPLIDTAAWQPGDQTAEVAGINVGADTNGNYAYAIQIGWAIQDMLGSRP